MNFNLPKSSAKESATSVEVRSFKSTNIQILAVLIFIALFFWFMIKPKRAELAEKRAELAVLVKERGTIQAQTASLKGLIAKMGKFPAELAMLDEALPLDSRRTKVQILVQNLANESGVTVGDVAVTAKEEQVYGNDQKIITDPFYAKRTLKTLSCNVNAYGDFFQLKSFLQKIENSGRLMDITGMDMTPSGKGQLGLRINFKTYYFAP